MTAREKRILESNKRLLEELLSHYKYGTVLTSKEQPKEYIEAVIASIERLVK